MAISGPPAPLPPDPQHLVREAAAELSRRPLRDYADALRTLRDKGFSYRDIAAWLAERGVVADHNAVYRVISEAPPATPGVSSGARTRKRRSPSPAAPTTPTHAVSAVAPPSAPPAFEESTLLD